MFLRIFATIAIIYFSVFFFSPWSTVEVSLHPALLYPIHLVSFHQREFHNASLIVSCLNTFFSLTCRLSCFICIHYSPCPLLPAASLPLALGPMNSFSSIFPNSILFLSCLSKFAPNIPPIQTWPPPEKSSMAISFTDKGTSLDMSCSVYTWLHGFTHCPEV